MTTMTTTTNPAMNNAAYQTLPVDLAAPADDGACDHLKVPGAVALPRDLALPATTGEAVAPGARPGRTVLYAYPRTGEPGQALPTGWDDIPGARGCTPEACAFRDHFAELRAAGANTVFGLSTQTTAYQAEVVQRLHLPFAMLSDAAGKFARALRLPTFRADGTTLLKRLTLVVDDGRVTHCFYPVFPPDLHAAEVLAWLRRNQVPTAPRS